MKTELCSTNQTYPKWFQHKELGKQIQRAKEYKIPSEQTVQQVKLRLRDCHSRTKNSLITINYYDGTGIH